MRLEIESEEVMINLQKIKMSEEAVEGQLEMEGQEEVEVRLEMEGEKVTALQERREKTQLEMEGEDVQRAPRRQKSKTPIGEERGGLRDEQVVMKSPGMLILVKKKIHPQNIPIHIHARKKTAKTKTTIARGLAPSALGTNIRPTGATPPLTKRITMTPTPTRSPTGSPPPPPNSTESTPKQPRESERVRRVD